MSLFSSGNVFSVPSFSHRTSFRGGTCALSPTLKARFDQAVMGSMAREPGTWGHSPFCGGYRGWKSFFPSPGTGLCPWEAYALSRSLEAAHGGYCTKAQLPDMGHGIGINSQCGIYIKSHHLVHFLC